MALNWTEFPARVELFGDLFSIYETLDKHRHFHFECFPDHMKDAAYSVDRVKGKWIVTPRPERMPGLERLLDRLEREGHYAPTLDLMRKLRTRTMNAISRDRAAVDAMTLTAVADALDAADRSPTAPTNANSPADGIKTFGDFLADVRGVELAAAHTRADADAMGGEAGTGSMRMQAAVFEATAAYRYHPSFACLEAYVNQRYGLFTYAHLLRVRGEVCAARHCGTTEADQLPVEEVVSMLRCPGAPTPAPSPAEPPAAGVPPAPYTLNDIRDLLRYRQDRAAFEARLRSISAGAGAGVSISEGMNVNYWAVLNNPQPPRLMEEEAVALPVYQWLASAARTEHHAELVEDTFLLIVGAVAIRLGRTVRELVALPLTQFEALRCEAPAAPLIRGERTTGVGGHARSEDSVVNPPLSVGGDTNATPSIHPVRLSPTEPEIEQRTAQLFMFAINGGMYTVSGFGESGHLPASLKGMGVIARLVRSPGVPVPWVELEPGILQDGTRTFQPAFDKEGDADFRATVQRLRTEVATAKDEVEKADSQRRLDELTDHLRADTGLQGKARDLNSPIEKLRSKIWGRIKTIYERLDRATPPMPNLAKHFEQCISSNGSGFLYTPSAPIPPWQTDSEKK